MKRDIVFTGGSAGAFFSSDYISRFDEIWLGLRRRGFMTVKIYILKGY